MKLSPAAVVLLASAIFARAEIFYATDFSGFQDGPLAGQNEWEELLSDELADAAPGYIQVKSGTVQMGGESGLRVKAPALPSSTSIYYGFDLKVTQPPTGGGKIFAVILSDQYSRSGTVISSPAKESRNFGLSVGGTIGRAPAEFPFVVGTTYRVVAGGPINSPPKIWAGETIEEANPLMESPDPARGPFTGFAFASQRGSITVDNLVIATDFEEAADPANAAH